MKTRIKGVFFRQYRTPQEMKGVSIKYNIIKFPAGPHLLKRKSVWSFWECIGCSKSKFTTKGKLIQHWIDSQKKRQEKIREVD